MIGKWFSRNKEAEDLPDYWKKYSAKFEEKYTEDISQLNFIVLDTETTGFNYETDRILSIGAVCVRNNQINIKNNFEVFLEQATFNPETVKIHGIIQNEKFKKYAELEALKLFLVYIGNSVLVAHHAGFDRKMINKALERHSLPKLKNRFLDTAILYRKTRIVTNLIDQNKVYSLDEIAEAYNIELTDRHTASGDAFITALIFMKLLGRIKSKKLTTRKLLKYRY